MLSPNARNVVTVRTGGATTVTENVQESNRCSVSVAVQRTVVRPMANIDPETGSHVVVTGGLPLTAVAIPYTTGIAAPVVDCTVCDAGQVIFGGSGSGVGGCGVGVAGVEQPASVAALANNPIVSTRCARSVERTAFSVSPVPPV